MKKNKTWKDYKIAFDYQHRTIMLLDETTLRVKSLQVGNPKKKSLELNVDIQWQNYFSTDDLTHTMWCDIILNKSWHFRTFDWTDCMLLSNSCSVNKSLLVYRPNILLHLCPQRFNSFSVIWNGEGGKFQFHREPLNPYSITLKQALQQLKQKLQVLRKFKHGMEKIIYFDCIFDRCVPPIPPNINENVLLHDIYKHIRNYPNIPVYWEITYYCMVPYEYTIPVQIDTPLASAFGEGKTVSTKKEKFNPLLFENDFDRIKAIEDKLYLLQTSTNNQLKELLHEIIKNGYLTDLISTKVLRTGKDVIKQNINYNKKNPDKLILNDKILTILKELKILYHNNIHKQMGYPLQLYHICAIVLYCSKSCNTGFSSDQINFKHDRWTCLDMYLHAAITILHNYERREESNIDLYSGLKQVRLEDITKIEAGYFVSHVSTSDDLQVAKMYRSDRGCILHFHPSMRRAFGIKSCDVSWISEYKHEREILFARSITCYNSVKDGHKGIALWNAKIESEDEDTQMILLTWTEYDEYLQQTMEISAIWGHCIDLNLIYVLAKHNQDDINEIHEYLSDFCTWKEQKYNDKKYEEKMKEFVKLRCCNDNINLFWLFLFEKVSRGEQVAFECAIVDTVIYGLPFVEKDKATWKKSEK
ncbi:hypothetical protein RFI_00065 [Reticulomyxa filosa]|uniref:Uncharacterized protein n=1 Tax=Reticulomyxa filosa TaxID=46433 RepID=X6PFK6_RETFI|nr:hypothetical protein RFI_00065 [Reticulomyxa filosa]|eukprot:ETO36996.1 hypothetical protein RFI_00065 [Reticulomyxa filosa]